MRMGNKVNGRRLAELAELPMFSGCTRRELELIDRSSFEVDVDEGRILMRQGELARECMLIVEGQVEISRDGVVIAVLGPGQPVGEMGLLDGTTRSATATAVTRLRLLAFFVREFSVLLDEVPAVANAFLLVMTTRLRRARWADAPGAAERTWTATTKNAGQPRLSLTDA